MPLNLQVTNPKALGPQSSYLTLCLWWNFVFCVLVAKKTFHRLKFEILKYDISSFLLRISI